MRHGQGKFFYPSGEVYEGGWHNDMKHGEGEKINEEGDEYKGKWD